MDWLRIWFSRCLATFRRRKLDEELDEELRSHIDLAIEDNLRKGMSKESARTAALRSFGGLIQTKEMYRIERDLPFVDAIAVAAHFHGFLLKAQPSSALGRDVKTGTENRSSIRNCKKHVWHTESPRQLILASAHPGDFNYPVAERRSKYDFPVHLRVPHDCHLRHLRPEAEMCRAFCRHRWCP